MASGLAGDPGSDGDFSGELAEELAAMDISDGLDVLDFGPLGRPAMVVWMKGDERFAMRGAGSGGWRGIFFGAGDCPKSAALPIRASCVSGMCRKRPVASTGILRP